MAREKLCRPTNTASMHGVCKSTCLWINGYGHCPEARQEPAMWSSNSCALKMCPCVALGSDPGFFWGRSVCCGLYFTSTGNGNRMVLTMVPVLNGPTECYVKVRNQGRGQVPNPYPCICPCAALSLSLVPEATASRGTQSQRHIFMQDTF